MRDQTLFDRIDLHLIRVLHTVLTERSVSRAAIRLGMHQPAVSAALKRLRELAGDPLLVRNGATMVATDAARRMVEPAAHILRAAEALFTEARQFDPRTSTATFRIAASDYLDPSFLPRLVADVKRQAPLTRIEIHALTRESDYRTQLGQGDTVVCAVHDGPVLPNAGLSTHVQAHLAQLVDHGRRGLVHAPFDKAIHHAGKVRLHGAHRLFAGHAAFRSFGPC